MISRRIIGAVGIMLACLGGVRVAAAGNAYHTGPKTFDGSIAVISASDHSPVGDVFIATKNISTSSAQLAMRVLVPGTAYRYDTTDSDGRAKLFVLPLGDFSVWKPGYWPEEVKFHFRRGERMVDDKGMMTIMLKAASDADRAAAARKAGELFGLIRPDGRVSDFEGPEKDPSEQVRRCVKAVVKESGGLP